MRIHDTQIQNHYGNIKTDDLFVFPYWPDLTEDILAKSQITVKQFCL